MSDGAQTLICRPQDEYAERVLREVLALTVITFGCAAIQRSIGPA